MISEKQRELTTQLYFSVGQCLTAWNGVEGLLATLVEHGHSKTEYYENDIAVGYWAIVSLEARIAWCDAIASHRLRGSQYAELRERWTTIVNRLKKKARKRNEIAHGRVISTVTRVGPTTFFVPYYNQRLFAYHQLPVDEFIATDFSNSANPLNADQINERCASFRKLRNDLRDFLKAWREKDRQTGFHEPTT